MTKLWALPDTAILFLAVPTVTAARYLDPSALTAKTWLFALVLAALHLLIGATSGPYAPGRPSSSVGEVLDLTRTLVAVAVLGFSIEVLSPNLWVPRSVPLLAAAGTLVAAFALRFVVRAATDGHDGHPPRPRGDEAAEEVELDEHRR
ncbi:hypothetical protein [Janibacter anophelis]|uniref:hypothetical protein n=1 Tax=Janibacter anophelis TaxID=319054 RepID=UPI000AA258D4|nr:hypothetical protein [Janibacter anophelis]